MKSIKQNALIIGGTSGLGLELALLTAQRKNVIVTGRKQPKNSQLNFRPFDLGASDEFALEVEQFVSELPHIDLLIYSAGFYQKGLVTDLTISAINQMVHVGFLAPIFIVRQLLLVQGELAGCIAITSTSQLIPREEEPVYCAMKAACGMLFNSLSLDERMKKVLVAGPGGMDTDFWAGTNKDTSKMLDPSWVAKQILEVYNASFSYKFVTIPRDPPRVILEDRR